MVVLALLLENNGLLFKKNIFIYNSSDFFL